MQVHPIKPTLKAPGANRLILTYDELVSSYAFKFNLRRYNKALTSDGATPLFAAAQNGHADVVERLLAAPGAGAYSSTFQLNLSRFGRTCPCPAV